MLGGIVRPSYPVSTLSMDGNRFDTLTKTFVATRHRRGALRLLAASPLAGLLALTDHPRVLAAAPRLTRAPRVVTKSATSATIRWSTDVASDSLARYGTSHTYPSRAFTATRVTTHTLKLSPLSATTKYHYQVKSGNGSGATPFSADAHLKTCPADRPTFCKTACADPGDPLSTACCVDTDTNTAHCGGCNDACIDGFGCVNNSGNGGECCMPIRMECGALIGGVDYDCCGESDDRSRCAVVPTKGFLACGGVSNKPTCCAEAGRPCSNDCDCCGERLCEGPSGNKVCQ